MKFEPCTKTNQIITTEINQVSARLQAAETSLAENRSRTESLKKEILDLQALQLKIKNSSFLTTNGKTLTSDNQLGDEEIKKLKSIRLTLEHSSIKQEGTPTSFMFLLRQNNRQVFISKPTILERPQWKNEGVTVSLDSAEDSLLIEILKQGKEKFQGVIYDRF